MMVNYMRVQRERRNVAAHVEDVNVQTIAESNELVGASLRRAHVALPLPYGASSPSLVFCS